MNRRSPFLQSIALAVPLAAATASGADAQHSLASSLPAVMDTAGIPGLSIPCGFTSDRLPIGLQLMGRALDEATLLRVGRAYQNATDFHREEPAL